MPDFIYFYSDFIICVAEFYPDFVHPRRRASRTRRAFRGSIFADVRYGHWLVYFSVKLSRKIPRSSLDYTGWCVALGGTTALDTLGSQAFTGGERRTDVSIHLQRCIFLLWLLFVPVALVWVYARPVLLAFGQAERLSCDVQAFLRILIIGAPGYIAFESLKKYLQCQGKSMAISNILFAYTA